MNFDDAKRIISWEHDYYVNYFLSNIPAGFMDFRIREGFKNVHEILTHMIDSADDFFFFYLFTGKFLKDYGISLDFKGKTPAQTLEVLTRIKDLEIETLSRMSCDNYFENIIREEDHWISLGIVINHISEHKSYHMGQLFMMADLAGVKLEGHKLPYGIEP